MSEKKAPPVGSILWHDLTVANADEVKDFYASVVGWGSEAQSMGDYDDYCMQAADGKTVAGVCHARGENATIPAQWMVYLAVADLDASLATCQEKGGKLVAGPRAYGEGRYAIIEDPAGAVCALYQA